MADDQATFNPEEIQAAAAQACALEDARQSDRLLMLCQMTQGEFCVSELESVRGIQQPTLCQQLGALREEKMVNTRREGKRI